jgi:hypothetical protein
VTHNAQIIAIKTQPAKNTGTASLLKFTSPTPLLAKLAINDI